jgi:hypothetical protein
MADNKNKTPQERAREASDPSNVKTLQAEELSLGNILRLKLQIKEAERQTKTLTQEIQNLSKEQAKQIGQYTRNQKDLNTALKEQERLKGDIAELGLRTDREGKRRLQAAKDELKVQQQTERSVVEELKALEKSAGVSLYRRKQEASIIQKGLTTERDLIKSINKERSGLGKLTGGLIGGSIADLFRTQSRKQLQIDIARAKAGGGLQVSTGKGGNVSTGGNTGAGGDNADLVAGAAGPEVALIVAIAKKAQAPIRELGNQLKNAISAPLAEAANLLTGQDYGMGGGKANASGATSLLGGFSSIAKSIPFVGGLLGGLVDGFKAMLDATLGIQQANFRVGRAMNISADAADTMRKEFDGVALASGNIVVNSTRMLQSQIEIGDQLGINKQLSEDILVNDVKLRDILGLEAESRKVISDQAIITGRNAEELTKSAIGTVGAFNKLVGTSFKWSSILSEASKLTGVMGLTLAKFPEKIYNAVAATKTLGFDLKQLDATASSFLDFESSISAEFEAQVITGKDMNLTLARQAALNNDNVTLAKEITKNVGSAANYLNMNRIAQESIAKSVGLTRDGLADVLKKQEIYARANVTDEKGLVKKLDLLEQQGLKQKEISNILGEQGYETATQVSTAEKLTEIMERIKKTFVDFVRNSGLFDFLTDPQKLNGFIKGLADKIAGAASVIGNIIASVVDLLGTITFGDTSANFHALAEKVRGGSEGLSGSIRAASAYIGGTSPGSIGSTVANGAAQQNTQSPAGGTQQEAAPVYTFHHVTQLDGQVLTSSVTKGVLTTQGKGNSIK